MACGMLRRYEAEKTAQAPPPSSLLPAFRQAMVRPMPSTERGLRLVGALPPLKYPLPSRIRIRSVGMRVRTSLRRIATRCPTFFTRRFWCLWSPHWQGSSPRMSSFAKIEGPQGSQAAPEYFTEAGAHMYDPTLLPDFGSPVEDDDANDSTGDAMTDEPVQAVPAMQTVEPEPEIAPSAGGSSGRIARFGRRARGDGAHAAAAHDDGYVGCDAAWGGACDDDRFAWP